MGLGIDLNDDEAVAKLAFSLILGLARALQDDDELMISSFSQFVSDLNDENPELALKLFKAVTFIAATMVTETGE